MKIYIDADSCPVARIAIDIASQYNIPCVLICDTSHEITINNVETVTVPKGRDNTDFTLFNKILNGDIAITQDYGLASMCLGKGAYVINQNGLKYTNENIVYLMETRHEARKQRMMGNRIKGPKPRTKKQDDAFANSFEALISQLLKTDN